MAAKRPLTDDEIRDEVRKIMDGEESDPEHEQDSECEAEEDHLEYEEIDSDRDLDDEFFLESPRLQHISPTEDMAGPSTSISSKRTSREEDDKENRCDRPHSKKARQDVYVVEPPKKRLKGKDGHKWSSEVPPTRSKRTAKRNIIHFLPGNQGIAKELATVRDHFLHFISMDIVNVILQHTNEEITRRSQKYAVSSATTAEVTKDELMALFAILTLSAVKKDNHLNATQMFDSKISGTFYRSCMSCERFIFLINCLRFDSKETRPDKIKNDSFALIR